jgi:hypothetical protein
MDLIQLETSIRLRHPRPAIRGERLDSYGNLTNGKVSLKSERWVIGHANRVVLSNVQFTVDENGRQRVLNHPKKKRMVHAFAKGEILYVNNEFRLLDFHEEIRYNPYRCGNFTRPDGNPIYYARTALVIADKKEDGKPLIYIVTNPVIEVLI